MRNQIKILLLITIFMNKGFTMQPYRPEMIKYLSPTNNSEIHAAKYENAKFIKKNGFLKANTTFEWKERIHPKYIFSDISGEKIILVGGIGDSGLELGKIYIYSEDGEFKKVDLAENIKNLEKLSSEYGLMGNFPWLTAVDIVGDTNELKVWVCADTIARVSLSTGDVIIEKSSGTPDWAKLGQQSKSGPKVFFTESAKKYLWERKDID